VVDFGLFFADGVGEGEAELVVGEGDCAVAVGWIVEDGLGGFEGGDGER
jgi:hypothetical protein